MKRLSEKGSLFYSGEKRFLIFMAGKEIGHGNFFLKYSILN